MRELSNLALSQLAAWEAVAKKWIMLPVYLGTEDGHRLGAGVLQLHYTCGGMENHGKDTSPQGPCGQAIISIDNGFGSYHTSPGMILAAVTAHIRNVHRELEDMVYGNG
jgi:hypothetical protein